MDKRAGMGVHGVACRGAAGVNVIAPTARADARYCSAACRKQASRMLKCDKIDVQAPDTGPPENVTASVQETQQNWGSKSAPRETEHFPACIWRGSHQGPQPERLHFRGRIHDCTRIVSRKGQILFSCSAGAVHT